MLSSVCFQMHVLVVADSKITFRTHKQTITTCIYFIIIQHYFVIWCQTYDMLFLCRAYCDRVVLQVSWLLKGETALILRVWPAPILWGLSQSPAWLYHLCSTGESQAVGTRPAVSPRCVACMAFHLSQIFPVWTKARWKPHFTTPAVFSLRLFLLPYTRANSSRGAGTKRAPHTVLPLHQMSHS